MVVKGEDAVLGKEELLLIFHVCVKDFMAAMLSLKHLFELFLSFRKQIHNYWLIPQTKGTPRVKYVAKLSDVGTFSYLASKISKFHVLLICYTIVDGH